MSYAIVLTQKDSVRDVGENVFFRDIPADYKVYLFYYSGRNRDQALENKLRNYGDSAGKNLFVNIGSDFNKISKMGIVIGPLLPIYN